MNLIQRLHNLWKLSELEPKKLEITEKGEVYVKKTPVPKFQAAQIIKLHKDPVEEALKS